MHLAKKASLKTVTGFAYGIDSHHSGTSNIQKFDVITLLVLKKNKRRKCRQFYLSVPIKAYNIFVRVSLEVEVSPTIRTSISF
jgi:hypothetical protein